MIHGRMYITCLCKSCGHAKRYKNKFYKDFYYISKYTGLG